MCNSFLRNETLETTTTTEDNRRNIDKELDRLDQAITDLRVNYEQHYSGFLPQPPEKQHAEVKRMIRQLYNSPFKNTANSFRLTTLNSKFQTYATYWERIQKQRESGRYKKDIFKANLYTKERKIERKKQSSSGAAEKGIEQLFRSYERALISCNKDASTLDYKAFKNSLLKNAEAVKKATGAKGVGFQVVISNGRVRVKTNPKK